jgi:hypothetical protein
MINPGNIAYWMSNPIEPDALRTLDRINRGIEEFDHPFRRLDVAFLIARKCVIADYEGRKLIITDKGKEALSVFADVLTPPN